MIAEQVYIFLYAIVAGLVTAFLYDIFRIKRRAIKTSVIILSLEDIVYWLLAAVILFITVYNSNNGQMRGYIFIGNVIGVIIYETLLSSIIIKSSIVIINMIKKIFKFIWKVISYPFKLLYKAISIPVIFIFNLIVKFLRFIGLGIMLAFRKTDVKGKASRLGKRVRGVKLKVSRLGKKGLKRIVPKKGGASENDKSGSVQKRKRRKKAGNKKEASQIKDDTRAS